MPAGERHIHRQSGNPGRDCMTTYLDFEKPLAEIEGKAEELRTMARRDEGLDVEDQAAALDRKAADMLADLYRNLTP
jgi:acetyl-CoA carboxylase carboxyl transferase subunit alpha